MLPSLSTDFSFLTFGREKKKKSLYKDFGSFQFSNSFFPFQECKIYQIGNPNGPTSILGVDSKFIFDKDYICTR